MGEVGVIQCVKFVRQMRGETGAALLGAADGRHYVVKFANDSRHRRVLVNELLSSQILQRLGISTPAPAVVQIDDAFIREHDLRIQPGPHFGSQYPGDPEHLKVYDILPDLPLLAVANLNEFLGVLLFDKWVANLDRRQAIFSRKPSNGRSRLVASMIDHGLTFGGAEWRLTTSAGHGLYYRDIVYRMVSAWADFEPWLTRIETFSPDSLQQAALQIPGEWVDQDRAALDQMLERLLRRRQDVRRLIEELWESSFNPFPCWSRWAAVTRREHNIPKEAA